MSMRIGRNERRSAGWMQFWCVWIKPAQTQRSEKPEEVFGALQGAASWMHNKWEVGYIEHEKTRRRNVMYDSCNESGWVLHQFFTIESVNVRFIIRFTGARAIGGDCLSYIGSIPTFRLWILDKINSPEVVSELLKVGNEQNCIERAFYILASKYRLKWQDNWISTFRMVIIKLANTKYRSYSIQKQ